MKSILLAVALMSLFLLPACDSQPDAQAQAQAPAAEQSGLHQVEVKEVVQASTYTYLNVSENSQDYWIAISKREIEAGQTIFYQAGLEMVDFHSQELSRTFEKILFVDRIMYQPPTDGAAASGMASSGTPTVEFEGDISLKPVKDGITIAHLFANAKSLEGKTVIVRGKVKKFNSQIMDRNWVHLQDGTSDNGQFDLTITTDASASVGEIATFRGKVATNRDFGAGYIYNVILETAERLDTPENGGTPQAL